MSHDTADEHLLELVNKKADENLPEALWQERRDLDPHGRDQVIRKVLPEESP